MLKPAALRKGAAVDELLRDKKLSSLELFSPVHINLASFFHLGVTVDAIMRTGLLVLSVLLDRTFSILFII